MEKIRKIFKDYVPKSINKLKNVVVLIAIIKIDGVLNIILEKRSNKVGQAGDVSFIGGHIDKGETPIQAIFREAKEECFLENYNIEIWGESDFLINFNSIMVHTFVGEIKNIAYEDIKYNEEVEKLIKIPLDNIINAKYTKYVYDLEVKRDESFPYSLIENGENYKFFVGKEEIYFYEIGDVVIWGMTAKILNNFINKIKGE